MPANDSLRISSRSSWRHVAARVRADVDGGQRQRDVHEPAVLRRVLRPRPDPGRERLLPDRHHDAQHARACRCCARATSSTGRSSATRSTRLDLGPSFRLEDGKSEYGRGIWAPCFRYHKGTFYIFSNVNGQTTQLFRATNPAGPWTRTPMKKSLHDLSVLFDDDGKAYVVWGYQGIRIAQLTEDLTDLVPGTERELIATGGRHGRRPALLQDQRQVLHHQRLVHGRDADARRPGRPPRGAVGGEPGREPRRGLRPRRELPRWAARGRRRSRSVRPTRRRPAAAPSTRAASSTRRPASGGASR